MRKKIITIDRLQEVAKEKSGKCLSKRYINSVCKLKWKCKEGHIFKSNYNHIQRGQWCPICSEGISERICRKFFEKIFNEKFPKRKYDWLRSPKRNKLELDGYNEKLKLAFEYQGRQHYDLKGFIRKKTQLTYVQLCDEIKRDQCKEKGIVLIDVPYTVKYEDMEKFILDKTKSNIPFKNLNYKEWDIYSSNKLNDLQDIVKSKGGECLSNKYVYSMTKLKWKCEQGHIWMTTPTAIRRGYWCPTCGGSIWRDKIKELKLLSKTRGGKCLSERYIGAHVKMIWSCKHGHKWETTASNIRKYWCPTCGKKNSWVKRKQNQKVYIPVTT